MAPRSDLPRKVLHTLMGLVALAFRWFTFPMALALTLGAVVHNRFVLPRLLRGVFLRPGEAERRMSGGVVLYPLAVMGLVLVFHDRLELAAAAWALLAFGDGPAAIVGRAVRGPRLPWNPEKSWSGLLAFVVIGAPAAVLLLAWTRLGAPDNPAVGTSFADVGTMGLVAGCTLAAVVAAWVESVDVPVDDNVRVVTAGALVLAMGAAVTPEGLAEAASRVGALVWAVPAAGALAGAAWALGGVGFGGALAGWLLATAVAWAMGPGGLGVLGLVVGLTIGATRLGRGRKTALGLAEGARGRRPASRVLANLGVAAVCAVMAVLAGAPETFSVMAVAALATAAFDTTASEVGQAFGTRAFLVPSFRAAMPGAEGAVSWVGTAAGLVAAIGVAGVAWAASVTGLGDAGLAGVAVVATAAFVGSTVESWIGGARPSAAAAHNDLLNLLNTLVGAGVAGWLWALVGGAV